MAVAYSSGAEGFSAVAASTQDTGSFSISGSNKYLRVLVYSGAGTPANLTSVVLDPTGVNLSLSQLESYVTFNTNFRASVWELINPPDLTNKIVRAMWAASQDEKMVIAHVYTGVNQATPNRALPTPAQGTSSAPSLAVTSVAGDLVVGSLCSGAPNANLNSLTSTTLTVRHVIDDSDLGGFEECAQGDVTAVGVSTTASYAISGTITDIAWVLFGAALIEAAGDGTTSNIRSS
jgi:hypothetical protein